KRQGTGALQGRYRVPGSIRVNLPAFAIARGATAGVNPWLKMNSWFYIDSGKSNAAFNMALDEALLDHAARLATPVLRFYGWTEPAASFGYFQKYTDVEQTTRLRPLVRRPTGGG